MKEKEAEKLAKRIKRVLDSVPKGMIVTITNSDIQISDESEYDEYVESFGHADNPPTIAYEILKTRQIRGNSEQL